MMMVEEVIDRVARSLGMPPEVVRETNLYREGDTTHYGQEVKDAVRIRQIWEQLKSESRFRERRQEIARFNAHAPHCKRGIAITPVKFGIAFTTTFFNQAGALVLIYRDGSIQVNHGGIEMGTGLHTKIRQIAAEALGVPLEWIQVMPTRTDKIPNTSATAASTGVDLNGEAVKAACDTLKQRLAQVASQHFAIDPAEVVFAAGKVYPVGAPERARAFSQMVHEAYLQRVSLFAEGFYRTPDLHFDPEQGQGKPFHYFAYGAAVSEVEVDGFTGQYHLRRVDILHDVGDSLSPLIDRGQIEGGFFQGLGWLTLEELVWDATSGKLLTQGASTYKLPSWSELPPIFQVRFLERATDPDVIYGSKAVGEPPLMLAIAVREALKEAIAAFGEGDIVELGAPSTPEAVYWAIAKIRAQLPKPTTAGIGISGLEKVEP
jgi:xanthine dehydrogenase large subunit